MLIVPASPGSGLGRCSNLQADILRRRLIALAAAYAIALASLIVSFGAARPRGGAAAPRHYLPYRAAGQPRPRATQYNKLCVECCGAGCLMLMAALPPPPRAAVAMPRATSGVVYRFASAVFVGSPPETKAHRSRAPPLPCEPARPRFWLSDWRRFSRRNGEFSCPAPRGFRARLPALFVLVVHPGCRALFCRGPFFPGDARHRRSRRRRRIGAADNYLVEDRR